MYKKISKYRLIIPLLAGTWAVAHSPRPPGVPPVAYDYEPTPVAKPWRGLTIPCVMEPPKVEGLRTAEPDCLP
jgi:hypothetical protein